MVQPGMNLLLVCRNVHQEAASTFYKNNTFIVTRNKERYDDHDLCGAYVAATAVSWLRQLGSHACFLDNLNVDLDVLCPDQCRNCADISPIDVGKVRLLDLGPLLCLVWKENLKLDLRLVHSEHSARKECWLRSGESLVSAISELPLNRTFRQLQEDSLDRERVSRAIHSIGMNRNGTGGFVAFSTTAPGGANFTGSHNRKMLR